MENVIKVSGIKTNHNSNFSKKHTKYLISLLSDKFYKERHIQPELLELIAGLNFAITGNFEAVLDDDADIVDDIRKTEKNLDELIFYIEG